MTKTLSSLKVAAKKLGVQLHTLHTRLLRLWVMLFACSFCPKQFIRFLLHFPIRVSNQHYKNSVTLKNQCIWSIFRPNSKQCKIGVSAIRGSVFGGFAVLASLSCFTCARRGGNFISNDF